MKQLELERHEPDVSWAARAADFDLRVFGAEQAWPREAWQVALAAAETIFVAYCLPPEGLQAHGDIVALGGIARGVEAEILTLGTAPAWQGRGLGGALLDELIAIAVGDEATRALTLDVLAANSVARALYASRGFEIVDRVVADSGERAGRVLCMRMTI